MNLPIKEKFGTHPQRWEWPCGGKYCCGEPCQGPPSCPGPRARQGHGDCKARTIGGIAQYLRFDDWAFCKTCGANHYPGLAGKHEMEAEPRREAAGFDWR